LAQTCRLPEEPEALPTPPTILPPAQHHPPRVRRAYTAPRSVGAM
jgi:hypothetical protein